MFPGGGSNLRQRSERQSSSIFEMPLTGRLVVRPAMRALAEVLPDFAQLGRRNRRLASLEQAMEGAANYGIWREAAMSYDKEAGLEEWKFTDASPFYDFKLIQRRLAQILGAREGGYLRA